jgi:hypothetical protein
MHGVIEEEVQHLVALFIIRMQMALIFIKIPMVRGTTTAETVILDTIHLRKMGNERNNDGIYPTLFNIYKMKEILKKYFFLFY